MEDITEQADKLVIANKEKDKRADELVIANQKKKLLVLRLKRAASVFSHANESIMITDASATITEVNGSFSRNTGCTPDEVMGGKPQNVSIWPPLFSFLCWNVGYAVSKRLLAGPDMEPSKKVVKSIP